MKTEHLKLEMEDIRLMEPLAVCCAYATVLLEMQDLSFIQWQHNTYKPSREKSSDVPATCLYLSTQKMG